MENEEAGEGRHCVFQYKFLFLDKANIDLRQLKPLPELVDFRRKPVCIPLIIYVFRAVGCFPGPPDWLTRLAGSAGSILQAMVRLQFPQDRRAGLLDPCCRIWAISQPAIVSERRFGWKCC